MVPITQATVGALTKNDSVFIASGVGGVGEFHLSDAIKGDLVTQYGGTTFAARANQRSYVGFNEVTAAGTLPISAEAEYRFTIVIKDNQRVHGQKQTRELYNYEAGLTPTANQAAFAMASLFGIRSMNGNYKQFNGRFVDMEVVSDAASQGVSDNAVDVTYGSKRITYTTAAEYGAGAYTVAVGDYLTFDNADGTKGDYLVQAVDGLIVTLDQPYNGATKTVAAGDSDYYLEAQAVAANYGFRIDSQTVTWNNIDTDEIVAFDASYFDISDTDISTPVEGAAPYARTVAPFGGAGHFRQVYDLEYFAQGNIGVNSRMRWYDSLALNPAALTDVTGATSYNMLSITFDKSKLGNFQSKDNHPCAVNIAIPNIAPGGASVTGNQEHTAAAGTTVLNLAYILNQYFATTLGFVAVDFG
jgi:hypothetical protein